MSIPPMIVVLRVMRRRPPKFGPGMDAGAGEYPQLYRRSAIIHIIIYLSPIYNSSRDCSGAGGYSTMI